MPADMNDYFKKRTQKSEPPKRETPPSSGGNGGNRNINLNGNSKIFSALIIVGIVILSYNYLKAILPIINSGRGLGN